MASQTTRSTVLLSNREGRAELAQKLQCRGGPTECVESLADLTRRRPLESVAVLVVDPGEVPGGLLLADLGRLNVELPGLQKVALIPEDPPLEVVRFLTSCGVDILLEGTDEEADEDERLSAVVGDLRERARWSVS